MKETRSLIQQLLDKIIGDITEVFIAILSGFGEDMSVKLWLVKDF